MKFYKLKFLLKILFCIILFKIIFYFKSKSKQEITLENVSLKTLEPNVHRIDPFDNYKELHKLILKSSKSINKKIVICKPVLYAGYGNKIYTVLSSLLIAILTDSAIRINWPKINNYIQPTLLDIFDDSLQFYKDYFHLNSSNINNYNYTKNYDELINNYIPERTSIFFDDYNPYFFLLCANKKYHSKLLSYDLVKQETIDLALYSQSLNKSDKIERLYSIGFEVGSNLLNKFWHLGSNIQSDVDKIYNLYFKDNFVIGIQLRFLYLNVEDIANFLECAFFVEKMNRQNKSKYFITSDNETIYEMLSDYEEKIIRGRGKIGHIGETDAYYRTILDNELLAKCNEIIITGGSTFGFVASMRKGIMPYYIESFNVSNFNPNLPCKRATFDYGPRTNGGFSVV
ncbi:unnamed protein product [Brachionus calyciflorus]|uniref:Uncharacterized protein n=1 Tax=Brachionus calyciflorus TaxID=104777 RepID=A0A814G0A7_9BILA|nr:unnamed protein product [Brachionus calyciflorus]